MTYADVKIRKEHAVMLRELAVRLGVKVADVVALWPRCPKCGGLLVSVEEASAACPNCQRGYIIMERVQEKV